MISKQQSIANFIKNMDDLISSNYILADKKISIMLKGVSSSKLFIELFEFCAEGFNFELAQKRAFLIGSGYGAGRFVLPSDSRSIIALVFWLLCQLDNKSIEFLKLLENYFNAGNFKESFNRFAREVLTPFKNETLFAVNSMLGNVVRDEKKVIVEKVEKPVLTLEQSDKIKTLLNESKAIILQYKMEDRLKAELLALYDDFLFCLYGTDADRLKVSFLGYKYSTLYHRKLDVSVGEIEKILTECGILQNYD